VSGLVGGDVSLVVADTLRKDEDGFIIVKGRNKKTPSPPP
jgi:non-ribosomal peptide synthetase component E (peptide arylation enzyme)